MSFDAQQEFVATRQRLLNEGVALVFLLLAVLAGVALYSFDPSDPGWAGVGRGDRVQNLGGPAGAWFASLAFALIGWAATVIPVTLGWLALLVMRLRQNPTLWYWPLVLFRCVGFVLFISGLDTLLTLHLPSDLSFSAGGYLGIAISEQLFPITGILVLSLVAVAATLLGLTLATRLSWISVLDLTGRLTLSGLALLVSPFTGARRQRNPTADTRPRERRKKKVRPEPVEPYIADADEAPDQAGSGDRSSAASQAGNGAGDPARGTNTPAADARAPDTGSRRKPSIQPLSSDPQPTVGADGDDDDDPVVPELQGTIPGLDLLDAPRHQPDAGYTEDQLGEMSRLLETRLKDFGVTADVVAVCPGPVITRFEIQPAPGVKVAKISNLAKDLARSLAMVSVRVVEIIPGKSVVGIEVPNENRAIVSLYEVLASDAFSEAHSPLTLALGHDIAGSPVVANLPKMPHLLVAGTTGSGKSVGVNAMLLSILLKATPEQVRMILIDPKMLELSVYDGIPHLLTPVITDMKDAANGLRWCVAEMERRYKLMSKVGVRNLAGFNKKVRAARDAGQPLKDPLWNAETSLDDVQPELEPLPSIVVVIDEFADMMMIVGKKVEELIARIAQKARAAGIHMILATQRPSVDVITGLIKANVPTRIAFQVSSKVDSRTILDQGGAEQLLGHGDMLFMPPGTSLPIRVHGAFVDDDEVHRVVAEWKRRGSPEYIDDITAGDQEDTGMLSGLVEGGGDDAEADPLFDEAVACVTESGRASISSVQRKLRIGYNRAARLIEGMEAAGIVSPPGHNGSREVLAPPPPER